MITDSLAPGLPYLMAWNRSHLKNLGLLPFKRAAGRTGEALDLAAQRVWKEGPQHLFVLTLHLVHVSLRTNAVFACPAGYFIFVLKTKKPTPPPSRHSTHGSSPATEPPHRQGSAAPRPAPLPPRVPVPGFLPESPPMARPAGEEPAPGSIPGLSPPAAGAAPSLSPCGRRRPPGAASRGPERLGGQVYRARSVVYNMSDYLQRDRCI